MKPIQSSSRSGFIFPLILALGALVIVSGMMLMNVLTPIANMQQTEQRQSELAQILPVFAGSLESYEAIDGGTVRLPTNGSYFKKADNGLLELRMGPNNEETTGVYVALASPDVVNFLKNPETYNRQIAASGLSATSKSSVDLGNTNVIAVLTVNPALNANSLLGQPAADVSIDRTQTLVFTAQELNNLGQLYAGGMFDGGDYSAQLLDIALGDDGRFRNCFFTNSLYEDLAGNLDFSPDSPVKVLLRRPSGGATVGTYYCYNETDPVFVGAVRPLGAAYIAAQQNEGGNDQLLHPITRQPYALQELKIVYRIYPHSAPDNDLLNSSRNAVWYESEQAICEAFPGGSGCKGRMEQYPKAPPIIVGSNPPTNAAELYAGYFTYEREEDPVFASKLPGGGYLSGVGCQDGEVLTYRPAVQNGDNVFICVPDRVSVGVGVGEFEMVQNGAGQRLGNGVLPNQPNTGDYTLSFYNLVAGPGVYLQPSGNNLVLHVASDSLVTEVQGDNIGTAPGLNELDNTNGAFFRVGGYTNSAAPYADTLVFRRLLPAAGDEVVQISNSADQSKINISLNTEALLNGLNIASCPSPASNYKLNYTPGVGFACNPDQGSAGIGAEDDQEVFMASLYAAVGSCGPNKVLTFRGSMPGGIPNLDCVDAPVGQASLTGVLNGPGGVPVLEPALANGILRSKAIGTDTSVFASMATTGNNVLLDLNAEIRNQLTRLDEVIACNGQSGMMWNGQACVSRTRNVLSKHYVTVTTCNGSRPNLGPEGRGSEMCTGQFRMQVTFATPFNGIPHVMVTPSNTSLETESDPCINGSAIKAVARAVNITASGFEIVGGGIPSLDQIPAADSCYSALASGNYYAPFAVSWLAVEGGAQ